MDGRLAGLHPFLECQPTLENLVEAQTLEVGCLFVDNQRVFATDGTRTDGFLSGGGRGTLNLLASAFPSAL